MHRASRRAFTIIELMTVTAVVVILIILLLPAVQKVREAASRAQCTNNLKQIGIALVQYHTFCNTFPYGGADDDANTADWQSPPWGVYILPYLGRSNIAEQFQLPGLSGSGNGGGIQYWNGIAPTTASATPQLIPFTFNNQFGGAPATVTSSNPQVNPAATDLSVYRCPSDAQFAIPSYEDSWSSGYAGNNEAPDKTIGNAKWTVGITNYVPMSGIHNAMFGPCGVVKSGGISGPGGGQEEGILNDNYPVTIAMVTDGLSRTWLVGENGGAPNRYGAGGVQLDSPPFTKGYAMSGMGWADETNGDWWYAGSDNAGLTPGNRGTCMINCSNVCGAGFYSFHPGGCNVVYADTHVQFVNATIPCGIGILLTTIADGQAIPGY